MPYIKEAEWFDVPTWFIKVTGMQMDSLDLKLEVGQHPKVTLSLTIKGLLELMNIKELKKLIKYCEERLKCHI